MPNLTDVVVDSQPELVALNNVPISNSSAALISLEVDVGWKFFVNGDSSLSVVNLTQDSVLFTPGNNEAVEKELPYKSIKIDEWFHFSLVIEGFSFVPFIFVFWFLYFVNLCLYFVSFIGRTRALAVLDNKFLLFDPSDFCVSTE